MNSRMALLNFSATMALAAGVALADWPNANPTKWVQEPDRTPTGMDVLDSSWPGVVGKILADDFLCTTPGPISDIHVWGSWLNDQLPRNSQGLPDANAVRFKLSIHADVPAAPPDHPYSMPVNPPLWQRVFEPGEYVSRIDGQGTELFFNPNNNQYMGTDSQIWQYNFDIPPAEAFFQQGTTANPIVYWLDVQAEVPGQFGEAVFGWKTSLQHWNDDAVFGDALFGSDPPTWTEMRYPSTPLPPGYPLPDQIHPYAGQSIDLAFAITTVPEPTSIAVLGLAAIFLMRRRPSRR